MPIGKKPPEIIAKTMMKKVNIIAQIPVRTVYPTLYGSYVGIVMSPSDICKCLLGKAKVEEILSDGSVISLDMRNYDKINDPASPHIKEAVLEHRKSAVDTTADDVRGITMEQLKNHTAPLPRSHYLYNLKDNYKSDGEPISESEEAALESDHMSKIIKREQSGESIVRRPFSEVTQESVESEVIVTEGNNEPEEVDAKAVEEILEIAGDMEATGAPDDNNNEAIRQQKQIDNRKKFKAKYN